MFNAIIEALENFCIHQMRVPYELNDTISKMRTIIAYIDITAQREVSYRIYLGAMPSFAQRVATTLLEEDESDEETLIDMMLESANLVVGSAKVISSQRCNDSCTISTPIYYKTDNFDVVYDDVKVLTIENDKMIIAIKEI